MKHISSRTKKLITLGVVILATVATGSLSQPGRAGNLSETSVAMDNSRPSFRGQVAAGNSAGSTQLTIESSGNPSNNTNGLVTGDEIKIGTIASPPLGNQYTITNILDSTTVSLDTGLVSSDETENRDVVMNQLSTITVTFKPVSFLDSGSFQVLIPAAAIANDDGIADQDYWDFGGTVYADPTVDCDGGGVFSSDSGTGTANVSAYGGTYHLFVCEYTGTNDGSTVTMTIDKLINPAPNASYTAGQADIYQMTVEHVNSADAVIDSTQVSVGLIEAVRVTATVSPQITFSLSAVNSSQSTCGLSTTVTTTGTTVPFGEMTISAPAVGSHIMAVSTNAVDGYSVTARENDQLGRNGKTCTGDGSSDNECIIDTTGGGSITHTTAGAWSTATVSNEEYGFGYSLDAISGTQTMAFEHDSGGWKHFADMEDGEAAQVLMSNSSATSADQAYICYKLNVSALTVAGNYENHLLYTATATF